MKQKQKTITSLILLWLLLGCFTLQPNAEGLLGMWSADTVMRGQNMRLVLSTTGLEGGIAVVEVAVNYDSASFEFVKANSLYLGTPGNQVTSPDTGIFELQDNNGQVRLLAAGIEYYPEDGVVAELEFRAKAEANIGPATFQFAQGSFVAAQSGSKIAASSDRYALEIQDLVTEPLSANPLEPVPPTSPSASPGIDVDFNPDNQLSPLTEQLEDDDAYGIGYINTATETTTPAPTSPPSKPTLPPTRRTAASQAQATESPLRSVTGELLYVPESGLPVKEIPQGFMGGTESIAAVNIPVAKSEKAGEDLTLYYLAAHDKASFYSYEADIDRFRPYSPKQDEAKPTNSQAISRFASAQHSDRSWKILLISLLGLSSLTVLIYTTARNLRG